VALPDHYKILGVAPDSEDIVIQAAYRALMRRYHPDKNPSEAARKRTIEINAAYAVLGDPRKRASYDAQRKANASHRTTNSDAGAKSPPPPPPPPKSTADKSAPVPPTAGSGGRAGVIFASILTVFIIAPVAFGALRTNDIANNTMNVDENLTTTDMNAPAAGDADTTEVVANADAALNAAAEMSVPDLSEQTAAPVDYSTIESAARKVAKVIATKGIAGARAYSENCHKGVVATPSWTGADSCAAFDYAAAYIDGAVATQGGWPKDGYFDFQAENQSDQYAAAGAASYRTYDRLPKIKGAAQQAALEAFRAELARQDAVARTPASEKSPPTTVSSPGNSSE
jgi:hypothetical protein